jgi:hypothetical protein
MNVYRKEVDAKHNAIVGMPLETALLPVPFHAFTSVLRAHAFETHCPLCCFTRLLLCSAHMLLRRTAPCAVSCSYLCAPRTCHWIRTAQCLGSCLRAVPITSTIATAPDPNLRPWPCLPPACRRPLKPSGQGKVPAKLGLPHSFLSPQSHRSTANSVCRPPP